MGPATACRSQTTRIGGGSTPIRGRRQLSDVRGVRDLIGRSGTNPILHRLARRTTDCADRNAGFVAVTLHCAAPGMTVGYLDGEMQAAVWLALLLQGLDQAVSKSPTSQTAPSLGGGIAAQQADVA